MLKPKVSALPQYIAAGWSLIPLHAPDHVDDKGRKRGKSPLDKNWTKKFYKNKDQVAHMEKGNNVGVRLTRTQLVIDVDPRNFPDGGTLDWEDTNNMFRKLLIDCDMEGKRYPTVKTGSGGLHLYMTKPGDLPVRDSLPEYPGIEFKTIGRQVVAAGSVHPDTGKYYEWDLDEDDPLGEDMIFLADAPEAPKFLLDLIARPQGAAQAAGGSVNGGQYDQEEIAAMLDWLNPEDYQDHDDWLALMQACHHASGGDARIEFVEWSTRDPKYADHAAIIGQRWDSLHAEADEPGRTFVTHKTLLKAVRDAGGVESIPSDARDDFDSDPDIGFMMDELGLDEAQVPEHEAIGALETLNKRFWCVLEGGKVSIMEDQLRTEFNPPERRWQYIGVDAFKTHYSNKLVPFAVGDGDEKLKPAGEAWLRWPERRSADGIVFDPSGREYRNRLNLWTGWAVRPVNRPGGWTLLEDLIRNTLADGDEAVAEYVLKWCAYMFQFPARPAETAICFQGAKGTGKGTLGRALRSIAGRHGMHIASSDHLTGRFNSHLRDLVFLFADEALAPNDKQAESRLKALITEPMQSYEQKGKEVQMAQNHIHILMASNEDWVVPAGLDGERRFMLQRVSNNRQGDQKFFKALNAELFDNGQAGLRSFFWDMLKMDLKGWRPSGAIPSTDALVDQKLANASLYHKFVYTLASSGGLEELGLDVCPVDEDKDWMLDPVRFFKVDFYDALDRFINSKMPRGARINRDQLSQRTKLLKAIMGDTLVTNKVARIPEERPDLKPRVAGDNYAHCVQLDYLPGLRGKLEQCFGGTLTWGDEDDDF